MDGGAVKHPRYELRSITGYSTESVVSGEGKLGTTYWIADTWNCYREVGLWSKQNPGGKDRPCGLVTTTRRSQAERNLARLNREHDEWLSA